VTYALDTNTISFFLWGEGNVDNNFRKEIIEAGNSYAIPFIVAYEIKRWLLDRPTKQLRAFGKQFDYLFNSVENTAKMPSAVWGKAADIYIMLKQKGMLIGDADILIAAYCIVNDYKLVTDNTDDFKRINGLNFTNWK
jgi:tRNA(fMet)-specific endonuclease VapC